MARLIYLDEAGVSSNEPVSIVAGVIVHSDNDWKPLESAINHVKRHVPIHLRDGYIFHAKQLYAGGREFNKEDGWEENARWKILEELVAIPRELRVPVAIGYVRRVAEQPGVDYKRQVENEHLWAFANCLVSAALFLQKHTKDEIAHVVAENCDSVRKRLKKLPSALRDPKAPESLTRGIDVTSIKDAILFCAKDEAPLLQLADACAFVTRRFASEQKNGKHFFNRMMGHHEMEINFNSTAGEFLFVWRKTLLKQALPWFSPYGV